MTLLAPLALRAAADSFSGVLKVIEIAEHDEDPWAAFKLQTVEDQIAEHEQLIENLKRDRPANREEARERSEEIKKHRERIVALKKEQREVRREVEDGMTEIRGWLGLKGSEIVIECRGKWRREAQRLQPGVIVDFAAERVTDSVIVRPGIVANSKWTSPLDLEQVRTGPVGWSDASASQVFSWSRADLTATAVLRCEIKAETTRSGRSSTYVEIDQVDPSQGDQLVMEVRVRVYTRDTAGQRGQLLTPPDGMTIARTNLARPHRLSPLRARFSPSPKSEHGYEFEIVEVRAELP